MRCSVDQRHLVSHDALRHTSPLHLCAHSEAPYVEQGTLEQSVSAYMRKGDDLRTRAYAMPGQAIGAVAEDRAPKALLPANPKILAQTCT
jgi:hypothetical protein